MELRTIFHSLGQRDDKMTPHVCFSADSSSLADRDKSFPLLVKRQFASRFGSVRMNKMWFSGPWGFTMKLGEKLLAGLLRRSKYTDGVWVVIIAPPRAATLIDRLLRRKSRDNVQDVMSYCREIHASVTAISGVSAIRWYFEGSQSHKQTPAVATPDELPWM